MSDTDPTQEELEDVSLCGQRLWELDENRLEEGSDYEINVGEGKRPHEAEDAAGNKLFTNVSKVVWERPTYRLLYMLRDNYNTITGQGESETMDERKEILTFLEEVMRTKPMQYAWKYLSAKGVAPEDRVQFKKMLYQMWFAFYRRDGQNDSSGFEHVFLGESDSGEISGFHNWVQFWVEESKGHVDYRGYIYPRGRHHTVDNKDRVLACQFSWRGQLKNVTTIFIGTSPEFEMALYTVYFLAGSERNNIVIDGYQLCIRCYAIRSQYGDKIGSAFPELMGELDDNHD